MEQKYFFVLMHNMRRLEHPSSIHDYLQQILVIFSVVKKHFSFSFTRYPPFAIRRRLSVRESVGEVRLISNSNRCLVLLMSIIRRGRLDMKVLY